MKIKIREDALQMYLQFEDQDDFWERVLEKISGTYIEVDTDVLFKYEFNTVPIPGIAEDGVRIPEELVSEIIDDERIGKAYCELCNETSSSTEVCSHCGREDYLEPYF